MPPTQTEFKMNFDLGAKLITERQQKAILQHMNWDGTVHGPNGENIPYQLYREFFRHAVNDAITIAVSEYDQSNPEE